MTIKVGDRLPEAKFRVMGPDGPAVKSMSIPVIFDCETGSDTLNVKLGDGPEPDDGLTESAVGTPPVTVQPPTVTKPEFMPVSAARR